MAERFFTVGSVSWLLYSFLALLISTPSLDLNLVLYSNLIITHFRRV